MTVVRKQFRLRTLLIALAVCLSWLGWASNRYHAEQEAVRAVDALEGLIVSDYQTNEKGFFRSIAPSWLQRFLGRAYLVELNPQLIKTGAGEGKMMRPEITDDTLDPISKLTGLRLLGLGATNITDAGLDKLHNLSQLEEVDVTFTRVTSAGVDRLKKKLPKAKIHF